MASTSTSLSLSSSSALSFNPFSSTIQNRKSSAGLEFNRHLDARIFASSSNHHDRYQNHNSRLVDESMIVLRKRIHEMKMVERNYEPPSDWMDWEKRYYTSYDSMICQVMGFLQSQLMNTRPSMALAMTLVVVLSVPTSTVMILFHFLDFAKGVLHYVPPN